MSRVGAAESCSSGEGLLSHSADSTPSSADGAIQDSDSKFFFLWLLIQSRVIFPQQSTWYCTIVTWPYCIFPSGCLLTHVISGLWYHTRKSGAFSPSSAPGQSPGCTEMCSPSAEPTSLRRVGMLALLQAGGILAVRLTLVMQHCSRNPSRKVTLTSQTSFSQSRICTEEFKLILPTLSTQQANWRRATTIAHKVIFHISSYTTDSLHDCNILFIFSSKPASAYSVLLADTHFLHTDPCSKGTASCCQLLWTWTSLPKHLGCTASQVPIFITLFHL